MRIHGFGESVVLVTDIVVKTKMKYPRRRPGGWLRAPVKKFFYRLAAGTFSVLRNALTVLSAVVMVNETFKTEQCRMVARIFFRRTKILAEKFASADSAR
jgi:hypothetical protein